MTWLAYAPGSGVSLVPISNRGALNISVGFEEVDEGAWNVYFGPVWLGRLNERTGKALFLDPDQRWKKVLPMSRE